MADRSLRDLAPNVRGVHVEFLSLRAPLDGILHMNVTPNVTFIDPNGCRSPTRRPSQCDWSSPFARSTSPPTRSNVTLNVILSRSAGFWSHTGPLAVKVDTRGAGSDGDPSGPARASPHRPALASHSRSLDCRRRRGQSHTAIDGRPWGAKSAPHPASIVSRSSLLSEPHHNRTRSPDPRHRAGVLLCPHSVRWGAVWGLTSSRLATHD